MPEKLAIVGASVRAAAFSALRAGFRPVCGDRFADLDLRRRAQAVQVEDYPEGLAAAVLREPVGGWFYTGALENCASLVDTIAASCPLLGVAGEKLAAVRDPFCLAEALAAEGLRFPPIERAGDGLPVDSSWLRKPKRGSGGAGISVWHGPRASAMRGKTAASPSAWFFQKRVAGRPCSAVFVGDGHDAILLGATWQLVGTPWTGAGEFGYAGSLGPIALSGDLRIQWERIGAALVRRVGLAGLFGVDAILDDETLWPIEVNPRYTASIEVLERACRIDAVRIHVDVCRGARLPRSPGQAARNWCGKAILYARTDFRVPPAWQSFAEAAISAWPWPELADVPAAGTRIHARSPVVTVLAEAPDKEALYELLRSRAAEVEKLLYPPSLALRASV